MGLFSLVNDLSNMDLVTQEMQWYNNRSNRMIYLWKDKSNNWAGLIGVEVRESLLLIHQIVLTPQSVNQKDYDEMLNELHDLYPNSRVVSSLDKRNIIFKWEQTIDRN